MESKQHLKIEALLFPPGCSVSRLHGGTAEGLYEDPAERHDAATDRAKKDLSPLD